MKRLLFAFCAVLIATGFVVLSFTRSTSSPTVNTSTAALLDLSDTRGLYTVSASGELVTSSESVPAWTLQYSRISPIDGVLFDADEAPEITLSGSDTNIAIKTGVYAFSAGDAFASMTVSGKNFRITPTLKGDFYVDTRDESNIRIYSLSAILSVDFLDDTSDRITGFQVFPSIICVYNPAYNKDLRGADILRISMLNTVRYVDLSNTETAELIYGSENVSWVLPTFIEYKKRQSEIFKKAYTAIFQPAETVSTPSFLETSTLFFVNKEKARVLLKNFLTRQIRQAVSSSEKACSKEGKLQKKECEWASTQSMSAIRKTLDRMQGIDDDSYRSGERAIKEAYYLSYYSSLYQKKDAASSTVSSNPFSEIVLKVFGSKASLWKQEYVFLSELYNYQFFSPFSAEDDIVYYLNTYLGRVTSSRVINPADFLAFSFFLKEFLVKNTGIIHRETLDIVSYLITISNDYYRTIKDDDVRYATLSASLYGYRRILDQIARNTESTFFEQINGTGALVLKKEFSVGENVALPSGFLARFQKILSSFSLSDQDFSEQKSFYYREFSSRGDQNSTDQFALFMESLSKMTKLNSIVADYPAHLRFISLNAENQGAQGLLIDKDFPTNEAVQAYFAKFSGFDPATFSILNNPEIDRFFVLSFVIDGSTFHLQYRPEGKTIEHIVFTNSQGIENRDYEKFSISLEEREKMFNERAEWIDDPAKKRLYDFSRFFQTAYLAPPKEFVNEGDSSIKNPSSAMTNDMMVFAQKELIEKDFKNIVGFLPISIGNIMATITNGEYDITLSNLKRSFSSLNGDGYKVEIGSKYVFTEKNHDFYNVMIRETTLSYNSWIKIAPRRISIQEFQEKFSNLWLYLDVVASKKPSANANVIFDLERGTVIIDDEEFSINVSR